MNRRKFLMNSGITAGVLMASRFDPVLAQQSRPSRFSHKLPKTDHHYNVVCGYIEEEPIPEYTWAPDSVYEDFLDMKFGIRLHWGLYSILEWRGESWPFLTMSFEERQAYQEMYRTWNPVGFDADEWVSFFADSGAKMFSFTSKHHEGFSMYDTRTRVRKRVNWTAPGGPVIEDCDLAYSIMETPFKRDVMKELCDAAHRRGIKVDLYFSHPDWYDADFRPYNYHPLQVPDAPKLAVLGKERRPEVPDPQKRYGKSGLVMMPNPTPEEEKRMMQRHRTQLEEIITRYGKIDMVCLDQWLGPKLWPQLRDTMLHLRKLRPDIMFRARGIGNYGDYYTPEGFVPGNKENTDTPWFVIHALGSSFSYERDAAKYKGSKWVVHNLIDAAAKGGNFMAGIGPDGNGKFHPEAIRQLRQTGVWLKTNGEGIYATRPREGDLWKEGDKVRFTRTKDNRIIFAFTFDWPGEEFTLETIKPTENTRVTLLGAPTRLKWRRNEAGSLVVKVPEVLREKFSEAEKVAYGFKIEG